MMINLFKEFSDKLFGDNYVCLCCKDERLGNDKNYLCDKCYDSIEFIKNECKKCGDSVNAFDNYCENCKKKEYKHDFDRAFCVAKYSGTARKLVYAFKYGKNKYIAKVISNFMIDKFASIDDLSVDVVIPVPLGSKRLKRRGFNQSEIVAKNIAKKFSLNFRPDILSRIIDTETQTSMNRLERKENVKNAFGITSKEDIKNKTFLIIDDIITSGATVDEISKLLKKNGAKSVFVLTFCHA